MKSDLQKTRRQQGFAGLEILLILLAIFLVAGAGLFVYSKQSASNSANQSGKSKSNRRTAGQATAAPSNSSTGSTTSPGGIPGGAGGSQTPAGNQTTAVIALSSAGLQITVPVSLSDLTYHVSQSSGSTVVTFSTQTLANAIPACAASQGSGAFDTVIKANGQYSSQYPGQNPNGGLIKQYSSYYLAYRLPTGPCAKNLSPSQQTLLDDQAQAFYGSLGSVATT